MKSFARFVSHPSTVKAGQPMPVTGLAQVGISGLKKVQYLLQPADKPLPADDPYFTTGDWRDAEILSPPRLWSGGLAEGNLPAGVLGFDPETHQPRTWPMRYALAHWASLILAPAAGKYHLRCRTMDANDMAQPMPRPFAKSGRNNIQQVELTVEV